MTNKEMTTSGSTSKANKIVIGVVCSLVIISFAGLKINTWIKKNNQKNIPAPIEQVKSNDSENILKVKDITTEDHFVGSLTAPVKIIVYLDFEDKYSLEYKDILAQVKNSFGEQVVLAVRQYPVVEVHANAFSAALASECAGEQDKFWEMYEELFLANKENRLFGDEYLVMAKKIGLDEASFVQCLASEKYKDKVLNQYKGGKEVTVIGTPTTFINGKLVTGANSFEDSTRSDGTAVIGLKNLINNILVGK